MLGESSGGARLQREPEREDGGCKLSRVGGERRIRGEGVVMLGGVVREQGYSPSQRGKSKAVSRVE